MNVLTSGRLLAPFARALETLEDLGRQRPGLALLLAGGLPFGLAALGLGFRIGSIFVAIDPQFLQWLVILLALQTGVVAALAGKQGVWAAWAFLAITAGGWGLVSMRLVGDDTTASVLVAAAAASLLVVQQFRAPASRQGLAGAALAGIGLVVVAERLQLGQGLAQGLGGALIVGPVVLALLSAKRVAQAANAADKWAPSLFWLPASLVILVLIGKAPHHATDFKVDLNWLAVVALGASLLATGGRIFVALVLAAAPLLVFSLGQRILPDSAYAGTLLSAAAAMAWVGSLLGLSAPDRGATILGVWLAWLGADLVANSGAAIGQGWWAVLLAAAAGVQLLVVQVFPLLRVIRQRLKDSALWTQPAGLASGLLCTSFGAGYSPKAPGTFGALVALPLGFGLVLLEPWAKATVLVAATAFSLLISYRYMQGNVKAEDPQEVVFDETLGMAITLAFVPWQWPWALAAFVGFRFFDITKPGPVGWVDRGMKNYAGVMLDDVVAGLMAGPLLWAVHWAGVRYGFW